MEKKKLEVERYVYEIGGDKYYVYLIPESDKEDFTGFYIEKDGYGTKHFMVAFNTNKPNVNIEQIIECNISDWIYECEEETNVLTTIYDMVLDITFRREDLRKKLGNSKEE